MPASYHEAFKPPYSLNNISREFYEGRKSESNSNTSDNSSQSIRNQSYHSGYNQPQTNFQVKNLSDLQSMANQIQQTYQNGPSYSPYNQEGNFTNYPKKPASTMQEFSDHECNVLISKLLSCSNCRKKVMHLLNGQNDQEEEQNRSSGQSGGGSIINAIVNQCIDVKLLTTIIIGVILMYILDLIMR